MAKNRDFSKFPNAITVLDNGNVGIGTSNPIDKLTISGRLNLLGLNQNSIWFNQNAGGSSTGYIVGRSISSDDAQNFFIYDVAAAAFRMSITSAGNVGIGTTTANGNLQFSNNTNTRKIVLYQGGNNDYEFYGFGVESSRLIYSTYTSGDDHVFVSGASGTARNELMRIKGNGQILTPNQPSFLAYNSSGFTVTGGSWYNISNAILSETYDIGSCYNSSNGRFTAPVAGRYIFYAGGWSSISSNGDRYAFCARVNGGALFYIGGGNYSPGDTPLSGYSIVHSLAANDYVDLWLFSALTGNWGGGSHGVYWGGYLL